MFTVVTMHFVLDSITTKKDGSFVESDSGNIPVWNSMTLVWKSISVGMGKHALRWG